MLGERRMYLMVSSTRGEKEAATTVSNLNSSYGQVGRVSSNDLNEVLTLTSGIRVEDELKK
jgi:hypothetical protein